MFRIDQMTATFDRSRATARQNSRKRAVGMAITVADASSVQKNHVIEQRPISVRRRSELFKIRSKQRDVIGLDLGAFLHLRRIVLMMSQRVMRLRNADLRIRSPILFTAIHERGDSRQVGL